ncbi:MULTISPECIES: EpsG family protein [Marinomonas]|uniref:EpsG family protein n=1 Tax=Marinomonas TaxID=28253 RepID=UPI0014048F76|nr:EpsG family protein [Marinomonas sp. KMM3893]
MYIYWLLLLSCLPLFFLNSQKAIYLFFLAVFVSLFSALQSINVSADREVYFSFFRYFSYSSNENTSLKIEPFFYFLFTTFNKSMEFKVFAFFLVCFLGMMTKFILFYKYSSHIGLSVILFLSYLFLLQDMNQIRVGFAIGFMYLAMLSYFNGMIFRWFLLSVLATCLHYSSVIVFLSPFFIFKNVTQKRLMVILFLIGVFSIFWVYLGFSIKMMEFLAIIDPTGKLNWYLNRSDIYEINPIKRLLPHFLFLIPIIIKYDLLQSKYYHTKFFVQLYLLYVITFLILSPVPVLAYRISDIFLFSSVFVLPSLFLVVKEKVFAKTVVFLFALFQFIYVVYVLGVFEPYSLIITSQL